MGEGGGAEGGVWEEDGGAGERKDVAVRRVGVPAHPGAAEEALAPQRSVRGDVSLVETWHIYRL